MWGNRVMLPPTLRKQVLQESHEAHTGVCKMKAQISAVPPVFWPACLNYGPATAQSQTRAPTVLLSVDSDRQFVCADDSATHCWSRTSRPQ